MNKDYIKDYKHKELRQYILAFFLIVVSSIGLMAYDSIQPEKYYEYAISIISMDLLQGAVCILVMIFIEMPSNTTKNRMVYGKLPSDTVFSDIKFGKFKTTDFDIPIAQKKYQTHVSKSESQQTMEWNKILFNARKAESGSIIEAERSQLLSRDLCLSTLTLFILDIICLIVIVISKNTFFETLKLFAIPLGYLFVMFFVLQHVAKNKAKRLVSLVIKYDLLTTEEKSVILL